jgi:hypothetical protein
MRLKVLQFYRGWASEEKGHERAFVPGEVVNVENDKGEYLLATYPDRFKKHTIRRKKAVVEEKPQE